MTTILGRNQYGKAENRVVRITRNGAVHHLKDLTVSVALSGDMDDVHHHGSNACVLPTDTVKNTVYAFAKTYGIESAEEFGIRLARHFVTSQQSIHRARIRIEEYAWDRVEAADTAPDPDAGAEPALGPEASTPAGEVGQAGGGGHSFVRRGQETRVGEIRYDGESWRIVSGLKGLTVLNSTGSEFQGYLKDRYTTLPEAYDRVLATDVSARWRYRWTRDEEPAPDWDALYRRSRGHILRAFAQTYSRSLQQTLYRMGAQVVEGCDEIDEIRFSLPNKHHFLVDLEPFGLTNDHEVYIAADRPYGLIEATVLRDGAEAEIEDDTTLL